MRIVIVDRLSHSSHVAHHSDQLTDTGHRYVTYSLQANLREGNTWLQ